MTIHKQYTLAHLQFTLNAYTYTLYLQVSQVVLNGLKGQ